MIYKDQIQKIYLEKTINWLSERGTVSTPEDQRKIGTNLTGIEIWHPSDKFAGLFANVLKNTLVEHNSGFRSVQVKKIPRAPFTGKWVFPSEVEYADKETDVIIIDWGQ